MFQEFFHLETVPQLSRLFNWTLWVHIVPELSAIEPSIYHATAALAATHHFYEMAPNVNVRVFALQQYNKAIRSLTYPSGEVPLNVLLVACYLFCCVEIVRGDWNSAFMHIQNGIDLLNKRANEGQLEPTYHVELIKQFTCLNLQVAMINTDWIPLDIRGSPKSAESSISSLEDAKVLLDSLILSLMHRQRSCFENLGDVASFATVAVELIQETCKTLDSFSKALDDFVSQRGSNVGQEETKRVNLLRVQGLMARVYLCTSVQDSEMSFDNFLADFEQIARLSSTLVAPSSESSDTSLIFCDAGIIPALYLTGLKCRNLTIRRHILDLLLMAPRREGLWESALAYKVVKRVIEVEQGRAGGDEETTIPAEARIHHTWIQPVPDDSHSAFLQLEPEAGSSFRAIREAFTW